MLSAVVVAGGSSRRAGFDKLLAPIGGKTVIGHTLAAFQNCEAVDEVLLVVRAERLGDFSALLDGRFGKLRRVVEGGAHRQDSVRAGLSAIAAEATFIAVHDAARPLVTPRLIEQVFREAQVHGAAAAAQPVTDTLKRATADRFVNGGVNREGLFAMQTPQIFVRALLLDAYARVEVDHLRITDEVSALEHLGAKVVLVPNDEPNLKITFPRDLQLAELLLQMRARD